MKDDKVDRRDVTGGDYEWLREGIFTQDEKSCVLNAYIYIWNNIIDNNVIIESMIIGLSRSM